MEHGSKKMNKLMLTFVLIAVSNGWTDADTELNCLFRLYGKPFGYSCKNIDVWITGNHAGIMISGTHLPNKTNNDVTYLAIYDSTVHFVHDNFFSKFPSLEILNIQTSGLNRIERNSLKQARNLKQLWLMGNYIKKLEGFLFSKSRNLEIIKMDDNDINEMDENTFRGLYDLETLLLGNNLISVLHKDIFSDLYHMVELQLQSNHLKELPAALFEKTVNLERLDLKNNKIKVIDSKLFATLKKLKVVDLTYNVCIHSNYTSGGDGPASRRFFLYQKAIEDEDEGSYKGSKNDIKALTADILTCTKNNTCEEKYNTLISKHNISLSDCNHSFQLNTTEAASQVQTFKDEVNNLQTKLTISIVMHFVIVLGSLVIFVVVKNLEWIKSKIPRRNISFHDFKNEQDDLEIPTAITEMSNPNI